MRSRAEWALRAVAVASLLLLIWSALQPEGTAPRAATERGGLERTLVDATRRAVTGLQLSFDTVPGPAQRDWLRAIAAAGTAVEWRAPDMVPVAITAAAVPEPERRTRVRVAAPAGATVILSDALGAIDTVPVSGTSSTRVLRTASGTLSVTAPGVRARGPVPPPAAVRRILVLGSAGWESKFVIAALEEAGWTVDASLRVAPGVETRQGPAHALDTTRYSAVVALDAAAISAAAAINRFVSSGGGAILAGAVTRAPGFARMTPGTTGTRRAPDPRPGAVLTGLRGDAVVLERQTAGALVAARRSGLGRVVASGYDDTWRWRMRRPPDAPAEHREWWTSLVSAVAYAPPAPTVAVDSTQDPAPAAALFAALGPPSRLTAAAVAGNGRMPPEWLLFGLFLTALLAEVLSRRLRGLA
jgi:hypothetical protein